MDDKALFKLSVEEQKKYIATIEDPEEQVNVVLKITSHLNSLSKQWSTYCGFNYSTFLIYIWKKDNGIYNHIQKNLHEKFKKDFVYFSRINEYEEFLYGKFCKLASEATKIVLRRRFLKFKYCGEELLSEAYEVFKRCVWSYDVELGIKAKFSSYYTTALIRRFQDYVTEKQNQDKFAVCVSGSESRVLEEYPQPESIEEVPVPPIEAILKEAKLSKDDMIIFKNMTSGAKKWVKLCQAELKATCGREITTKQGIYALQAEIKEKITRAVKRLMS